MEGKIINDRYKAIRELKDSRDGKIYYVVEDTQNDNELKMLKGIGLVSDKQEEDAKSEVALLQKLDNDYVVKLLDDFTLTGPKNLEYHALILEYLPGGDLSEYLKEKLLNEGKETEEPWDENEALRITAQLAVALDYVHNQNVVHRDVKPENVLLSADKKTAKLADFNISRTVESTINTGVAGTFDYYPPETVSNQEKENLSFRRDIWSYGVVMQMLCTFRNPFATGNLLQTITNIAQNIRNPAEVAFPVMESLIKQCLVVEVGERVESVTALMRHPVLWSLVEQLKNQIKPENLVFGLNRLETKDVIKDHLIGQLQRIVAENQRKISKLTVENTKMADFMSTAQRMMKEAEKKISKLSSENLEKEKKIGILEKSLQSQMFGTVRDGFGFYYGLDSTSVREPHSEDAVRQVLRAMKSGMKHFNLKLYFRENLEVSEAGWTIRHQTWHEGHGGDGFWKLRILYNGKRVDFQADADDIDYYIGKSYNSGKKLTPDSQGMVKLKGKWDYVRWNITIRE